MPARTGRTTFVPGRGSTTRSKSGKAKTYTGSGPAPAGTTKVREPSYAEVPTVTVTSAPSGASRVTTSGYGSQKAAKRAVRQQQRRAKRVQRIVAETRRGPQKRAQRLTPPKKYKAPSPKVSRSTSHIESNPAKAVISSIPNPQAKPETFKGMKTAGEPSRRELQKAAKTGTLRVNRKGHVTTPRIRKVGGELRRLRKKARGSNAPLPGLGPEESKNARIVLRRGRAHGADRKELLAATETGLVESGFKNYTDQAQTDADSLGWRQERTSIYGTGPTGPTNVKASADRFYKELRTDAGTSSAPTPGLLAQAAQGSAFPERYDERQGDAEAILRAFNKGGLKPAQRKQLRKVSKEAKKLGLKTARRQGAAPSPEAKKLPGPYDGSRAMVRKILGAKVRGDKEEGHSPTGDHDPSQPNAYAQDIGSAGGNSAEGEPDYTQATLDRAVKNLRKMGADVPDLTLGADNWEGTVRGYKVQILTIEHGSGPHIHTGARWTGESTSGGYSEGGGVASGGGVSFSSGQVASYAEATGQSVATVQKKLMKGKLHGFQILKRLNELGVGIGAKALGVGESSTTTSQPSSDSVLADLERKYLGAAA